MSALDYAAGLLEQAKADEAVATARRIAAEQALVTLLGCREEGSTTHRGEAFKVTLTGVVHRKVDEAALSAVRDALPVDIFVRVFRFKPDVIAAGVKYLQNNEPALYAIAAQAITATPGKPSVRVEAIAQEPVATNAY